MKSYIKLLSAILGFCLIVGIAYATITIASSRKSSKLPWQGIITAAYDSAHNVGTSAVPQSRFSTGTSVVIDSVTGLYWQNSSAAAGSKTWTGAMDYCDSLVQGGYNDWRLPTVRELATIVDYGKQDGNYYWYGTYFAASGNPYWSSTTSASTSTDARIVSLFNGNSSNNAKGNPGYVFCTR